MVDKNPKRLNQLRDSEMHHTVKITCCLGSMAYLGAKSYAKLDLG